MGKFLKMMTAACLAAVFAFALAGCAGGVDKNAYVGTWQLESGSDENLGSDSIELMKSLGLEVTLSLAEDGTGTLNLFGESMDLTWEAKSNSEGAVTFDGNNAVLKLADGKLTLEDDTGSSMTFVKGEAAPADSPAASDSASAEAASSESSASAESASAEAASSEAAASAEGADAGSEGAVAEASQASEEVVEDGIDGLAEAEGDEGDEGAAE